MNSSGGIIANTEGTPEALAMGTQAALPHSCKVFEKTDYSERHPPFYTFLLNNYSDKSVKQAGLILYH
jgi:hypothetical protein